MNFLKYSFITLFTVLLIVGVIYVVASTGIKSQPGYAKFDLPSRPPSFSGIALNVGPLGVKPLQWVVKQIVNDLDAETEAPERILLGTLQEVQGVQLKVYQVRDNRELYDQAVTATIESLKQDAWQTVLVVREDYERIVVMQSERADVISGITLMVTTPEEAVFVNLLGEFNAEEIASYAGRVKAL